jgi:hypothetical protein
MPDLTRSHLTALRNGLLRWHKSLLDAERSAYERDVARISSTGQYLQLVLADPWFAWLREISQFIVIVDETLAQKEEPVTPADAVRLISKARDLLVPSENGSEFARSYEAAMQRDPAAVLAHGEMMQVLKSLTNP